MLDCHRRILCLLSLPVIQTGVLLCVIQSGVCGAKNPDLCILGAAP